MKSVSLPIGWSVFICLFTAGWKSRRIYQTSRLQCGQSNGVQKKAVSLPLSICFAWFFTLMQSTVFQYFVLTLKLWGALLCCINNEMLNVFLKKTQHVYQIHFLKFSGRCALLKLQLKSKTVCQFIITIIIVFFFFVHCSWINDDLS